MTALAMTQPPETRTQPPPIECCHCGRVVALKLVGKLVIKCRRCKKHLVIVTDAAGMQKNP